MRCIKSNPKQLPGTLDIPYALRQLKCSGVFEAAEIRRSGFPFRKTFDDFQKTFSCLVPRQVATIHEFVKELQCQPQLADVNGLLVGKTMVFMNAHFHRQIMSIVEEVHTAAAVKMQRKWRRYAREKGTGGAKPRARKKPGALQSIPSFSGLVDTYVESPRKAVLGRASIVEKTMKF